MSKFRKLEPFGVALPESKPRLTSSNLLRPWVCLLFLPQQLVCVMKYFLHQGCILIKTSFCDAIAKANLSLYLCVQAYAEIANIPPKGKYNCNLIVKNTNIKVGRSCYISRFKVPNDSMPYSHLFQCKVALLRLTANTYSHFML